VAVFAEGATQRPSPADVYLKYLDPVVLNLMVEVFAHVGLSMTTHGDGIKVLFMDTDHGRGPMCKSVEYLEVFED
jgi:hypothetical protein